MRDSRFLSDAALGSTVVRWMVRGSFALSAALIGWLVWPVGLGGVRAAARPEPLTRIPARPGTGSSSDAAPERRHGLAHLLTVALDRLAPDVDDLKLHLRELGPEGADACVGMLLFARPSAQRTERVLSVLADVPLSQSDAARIAEWAVAPANANHRRSATAALARQPNSVARSFARQVIDVEWEAFAKDPTGRREFSILRILQDLAHSEAPELTAIVEDVHRRARVASRDALAAASNEALDRAERDRAKLTSELASAVANAALEAALIAGSTEARDVLFERLQQPKDVEALHLLVGAVNRDPRGPIALRAKDWILDQARSESSAPTVQRRMAVALAGYFGSEAVPVLLDDGLAEEDVRIWSPRILGLARALDATGDPNVRQALREALADPRYPTDEDDPGAFIRRRITRALANCGDEHDWMALRARTLGTSVTECSVVLQELPPQAWLASGSELERVVTRLRSKHVETLRPAINAVIAALELRGTDPNEWLGMYAPEATRWTAVGAVIAAARRLGASNVVEPQRHAEFAEALASVTSADSWRELRASLDPRLEPSLRDALFAILADQRSDATTRLRALSLIVRDDEATVRLGRDTVESLHPLFDSLTVQQEADAFVAGVMLAARRPADAPIIARLARQTASRSGTSTAAAWLALAEAVGDDTSAGF